MAACTKCGAACAEDAHFCAGCGAVLGPDAEALERLIDVRARAIVAEHEAQAIAEKERAEVDDAEWHHGRAERRKREQLERAVNEARTALEKHKREPTTFLASCVRSITAWSVVVFLGVGLMLHMFVIPAIGSSPASVVCPLVCDGCRAPARTLSWTFKGTWHSANGRMGYAFVCTNPKIDVSHLDWEEVSWKRNAALQPYMLNSFSVYVIEVALLAPVAALVFGPLFGLRRRRRVLSERAELEQALERAQQELADCPIGGTS